MAFNFLQDPFAQQYQQPVAEVPKLKPQVAEDLLADIGDGLIGGLGYIGSILEKPSRALRGLLDVATTGEFGGLREGLSILPFSDSIGLTDPNQRVSGEKLLRNVGLISEPDTPGFDENDIAGIGVEVLLDPLSYLGVGTLTRAGKALQKGGGKVNTGFAGRARGAEFAQSDINALLGTGNLTARDLVTRADNVIPDSVAGVNPRFRFGEEAINPDELLGFTNPTTVYPKNAQEAIEAVRTGKGTPAPGRYTSLEGFGTDGLPRLSVLDATPAGATQRLTQVTKEATDDASRLGSTLSFGKLPLGIDRLLGLEPFRIESGLLDRGFDAVTSGIQASKAGAAFSRLFDSRVGNARTPQVQEVQREVGAGSREAYRRGVLEESFDLRQRALGGDNPLINPTNEAEAMRYLAQAAELGDTTTVGTQVRYGAPRTMVDYESQLAGRTANNPAAFPNRLEEMRSSGELAAMAGRFDELRSLGEDMNSFLKIMRQSEQEVGLNAVDLLDDMIEYLPRQKNPLPRKPGESAFAYAGRALQDSMRTTHEGQIGRREYLKGIPGGKTQIEDWAANQSLRGLTDLQRRAFFTEELTGMPFTANKEVAKQAELLSKWVVELGDYGKTTPLFSRDLLSAFERRGLGGAAAKGGMDATLEGVRRFAVPESYLAAQGIPSVKVSDILGGEGFSAGSAKLAQRDLRLNDAGELANLALPADVAADLIKVQKTWTNPEEVQGIMKLWDDSLQMFKQSVTYPFLAFHVRNAGSGVYNMWRDGAADWRSMKDAYKLLTSKADLTDFARADLVREAVSNRVAFLPHTKQFGDSLEGGSSFIKGLPGKIENEGALAGIAGSVGKQWKDKPKNWVGNAPGDPDLFWVVRQGKAAGSFVEDWIRMSHYLAKRRQGFDPTSAATAVRKYQYDYTLLTEMERKGFKRLIPWWSFSRNNLPPIMEELATNPARLSASIRASTSRPDNQFVPGYLSEGPAIPVPGAPPGTDRYLASLGLPFEDELIRMLGNVSQGKLSRATQQAVGTLAPQLKFPIENAFGVQAHSGRRLEDLKATPGAELLSALSPLSPNMANQLVGMTPLARFGTVSGQVLDERKDPIAKLLNLTTGGWVTDVDANKVRSVEVRDRLQDLLRGTEGVTNWEKFYVKPENLGTLTPEQLQTYLLYRTLEDQAKEAAAKKKVGLR